MLNNRFIDTSVFSCTLRTMAKTLNRNAFNEKLIHRYLIERYYFVDRATKNKLLPEEYHGKDLNLIVPEESNNSDDYRADLSLYFKHSDKRVPVEVKWTARELTKANQIAHLRANGGFIVSFKNEADQNHNGIPNIEIDYEDFKDWIASNISKLTRESITTQASGKVAGLNQYWLIFLRGESAEYNFQKMLVHAQKAPFWAFRHDKTALKDILNIQKGDTCIFLFGKGIDQGQGYSGSPDKELMVKGMYIATITNPYYMVLDKVKGAFFEPEKELNHRKWPHFINFKHKESRFLKKYISFGKQGPLGSSLARSVNFGGGTPAQLTLDEFESLTDQLRSSLGLSA